MRGKRQVPIGSPARHGILALACKGGEPIRGLGNRLKVNGDCRFRAPLLGGKSRRDAEIAKATLPDPQRTSMRSPNVCFPANTGRQLLAVSISRFVTSGHAWRE